MHDPELGWRFFSPSRYDIALHQSGQKGIRYLNFLIPSQHIINLVGWSPSTTLFMVLESGIMGLSVLCDRCFTMADGITALWDWVVIVFLFFHQRRFFLSVPVVHFFYFPSLHHTMIPWHVLFVEEHEGKGGK
jgi:hypothetical protein